MLKLVDAKKICCVALATMFSISLCACKKTNEANETATTETSIEMGATATATTITTAIEESTDSLWYAEIQNEIAQENHFGYVYKVNATSTCVYNTSEEVDAYLSQGDIFVTDKEITYGNMVKVWFQTDSGEIIQGCVAWNENSAGYYECIG